MKVLSSNPLQSFSLHGTKQPDVEKLIDKYLSESSQIDKRSNRLYKSAQGDYTIDSVRNLKCKFIH